MFEFFNFKTVFVARKTIWQFNNNAGLRRDSSNSFFKIKVNRKHLWVGQKKLKLIFASFEWKL